MITDYIYYANNKIKSLKYWTELWIVKKKKKWLEYYSIIDSVWEDFALII